MATSSPSSVKLSNGNSRNPSTTSGNRAVYDREMAEEPMTADDWIELSKNGV